MFQRCILGLKGVGKKENSIVLLFLGKRGLVWGVIHRTGSLFKSFIHFELCVIISGKGRLYYEGVKTYVQSEVQQEK